MQTISPFIHKYDAAGYYRQLDQLKAKADSLDEGPSDQAPGKDVFLQESSELGWSTRFQAKREFPFTKSYLVKNSFRSEAGGKPTMIETLLFDETINGELHVSQSFDQDGDGVLEVDRFTILSGGQILMSEDRGTGY